jgi:hypothetical protein
MLSLAYRPFIFNVEIMPNPPAKVKGQQDIVHRVPFNTGRGQYNT